MLKVLLPHLMSVWPMVAHFIAQTEKKVRKKNLVLISQIKGCKSCNSFIKCLCSVQKRQTEEGRLLPGEWMRSVAQGRESCLLSSTPKGSRIFLTAFLLTGPKLLM